MKKNVFNRTYTRRVWLIINYALIALIISACTKSDNSGQDLPTDITEIEGSENLGSGYDVFKNYAEVSFVKAAILDLSKLNVDGLIAKKKLESGEFFTSSGTSIERYCSSLSTSIGLEGQYMYFSGAITANFDESRYSQETYSFATVRSMMGKTQLQLPLDMTGEDLKPYLTDKARENLNDPSLDPSYIFNTYGTHCLTGVVLGGRLDYNISAKTSDLSSNKSIALYAEFSYGKKGFSASATTNTVSDEEYSTFMNSRNETLKVYGGLSEYAQKIINKDDYDSWIATINDNQVFCNFTQNGLMPVWEFCDDQARKEELISAFNTWAIEREIIVNPQPRYGILDVTVKLGGNPANSYFDNGIEYFLLPYDLNAGCGSRSSYIYIYYALGYDNNANRTPLAEICILDISDNEKLEDLPGDGWVEIPVDLNKNASGSLLHLAYRRQSDASDILLSGLRVNGMTSKHTDINNNWNVVTQGYDGSSKQDLNEGSGGDWIYLYYTRDKLNIE